MRALIAGWIGSTNLGDELVFQGLRRHLQALGISPLALSVDPGRTSDIHRVEAIRHVSPRDTLRLWHAVGRTDGLILGGGGLIQDQTSAWNLPFHMSRVTVARTRRAPWVGVGLGIDQLWRRSSRRLAAWAFRSSVGVAVRDPGSAAAGEELGVKPVVAADLALALPPPAVAPADRLVVTLRAPTRPGLGTAAHKARAAADPDWEAAMAGSLDRLASEHGLAVRFVALQADRDGPLHARIAARMTAATTTVAPGLDTIRDEFAACRLVVAMRYHGAIAALLASRPAVLLDYSQKMANLAAEAEPGFGLVGVAPGQMDALSTAASGALDHAREMPASLAALQEREGENRRMLERLAEATR